MMFYENYKVFETAEELTFEANQVKEDLAAINVTDSMGHLLDVVCERLKHGLNTEYGVYWPALKDVLVRNGRLEQGDAVSSKMVERYKGGDDFETIIASEEFRQLYLANFIYGRNEYALIASDGDEYKVTINEEELSFIGVAE